MTSPRKIPVALVAALLLGCICGCGGGGGGSDAGSITKARFVEKADQICEQQGLAMIKASDIYTRRHRHSGLSATELHLASIAASLPASLRNQDRLLRALGTPPGGAHRLRQLFKAEEQAIVSSRGKRPISLPQLFTWYERPDRLAAAYGIGECAIL